MLTKPELEGAIVFQELLQIMENLGFKEEGRKNDGDYSSSDHEEEEEEEYENGDQEQNDGSE